MRKSNLPVILFATLVIALIMWAPQNVLAQRGGHGGGGGGFHGGGGMAFHGGGGGGGWHGGGGSWHGGGGYYHGGGYYGHGGGYGWGGGYWGYPGWSFSVGFNWGPFWGGYGYPYYGYGYAPYYYPYYYPYAYPYPYYVPATPAAPAAYTSAQNYSDYQDNYAVEQSPTPAPAYQNAPPAQYQQEMQTAPAPSSPTIRYASYAASSPHYAANAASRTSANVRPAAYTSQQLPSVRPEVQNVIRALRAMPPAARQRQIDSGRYSNLTAAELEFVRRAANVPPA